ncbi:RagB/SusD family nutrient uptake outer membrane protein [Mucilaginibacter gynuensis]|uniref:RagB/SusD family nutrient uptake outer membrane protein n=1 Tax=Mucilaginibacter gynuensis TaxID=1302236 RepID=A0ABP8GDN6_9SPHI
MKNKYLIGSLMCAMVIAVLTSSCKKLLEQTPQNSTYSEVFWQSSRDLNSAIAGNYALLRAAANSGTYNPSPRYYMYGDAVAKSYFTMQYVGDGLENIQNGDYTFIYNLNSLANWTSYYKTIAMSNIVLSKVPGVPEDKLTDVTNPAQFKRKIMGQALFIRALSYFMMTRVWGDVPLVTEAYEDPISAPHLPRSPKADVMKQIEKDCHDAIGMLDWGYTNTAEAHITASKGSVYALLAHLYLWRATMTDVRSNTPIAADVASADTTLTAVIAKGGYTLTDTSKYYDTFVGRSNEGIFELNMSENTKEGSSWSIANMFLRSNYIAYNSDNSRNYVNTGYLNDHFYKLTKDWQWVWTGSQWVWTEVSVKTIDSLDVRYRKNFDYRGTDRPTCIKYHNVVYRNAGQLQDAYVSNNMIIFRLSDMKLLQAEVALYQGNTGKAIDIINSFRKRYGASPDAQLATDLTKDQVMDEYILERGKEMYLEGHIFYDLLRTRKYETFVPWLSSTRFAQEGFYWPVYPSLFSDNNLLKQTSYWLGKI